MDRGRGGKGSGHMMDRWYQPPSPHLCPPNGRGLRRSVESAPLAGRGVRHAANASTSSPYGRMERADATAWWICRSQPLCIDAMQRPQEPERGVVVPASASTVPRSATDMAVYRAAQIRIQTDGRASRAHPHRRGAEAASAGGDGACARTAGRRAGELERCAPVMGSGRRLRKGQGPGVGVRGGAEPRRGSALTMGYATVGRQREDGRGGVLEDSHDEGEETLTLKLSNVSSGRITDAGDERNDREQRPAAAGAVGGPRPGRGGAPSRARGGAASRSRASRASGAAFAGRGCGGISSARGAAQTPRDGGRSLRVGGRWARGAAEHTPPAGVAHHRPGLPRVMLLPFPCPMLRSRGPLGPADPVVPDARRSQPAGRGIQRP